MSRKLPPAPPEQAFRHSVLQSIQQSSASFQGSSNPGEDESGHGHGTIVPPDLPPGTPPTAIKNNITRLNGIKRSRSQMAGNATAANITRPSSLFGSPSVAAAAAAASQQAGRWVAAATRPLIRRRSSLFDSLPNKSSMNSRLSAAAVPETKPSPPSFFQRWSSQNSTLLGDDLPSTLPDEDDDGESRPEVQIFDRPRPRPAGSLFGAVMQKLGSTRSSSSSGHTSTDPSTPTKASSTTGSATAALMEATTNVTTALHETMDSSSRQSAGAGFRSPSGKSIRNIVNQFVMNSPFQFQSPKAKRRLLDNTSSYSNDTASTPQRKRRRLDSSASSPASMTTPVRKGDESSRSSLHEDENWREASIRNGQAQFVDWSLKSKLRLECHPPEALIQLQHSREWQAILGYWQYPASDSLCDLPATFASSSTPLEQSGSVGSATNTNSQAFLRRTSTVDSKANQHAATKLKRSKSMEGIAKVGKLNTIGETPNVEPKAVKDPAVELATQLIRSVRGPRAFVNRHPPEIPESKRHKQITDWKQAFRSLYLQWYQCIEVMDDPGENLTQAMADCYFYTLVDNDHAALFRVDIANPSNEVLSPLPRVVLSSCGDAFLQDLRDAGITTTTVLEDPTSTQSDGKNMGRDTADRKDSLLMSPTVKADLEALRRAQAYGEVAGADVSIKIKAQKGSGPAAAVKPQNWAITLSGYDDVAIFFEVYWNRLGNVRMGGIGSVRDDGAPLTTTALPKILCPRGGPLEPFLHASLKTLALYSVQPSKSSSRAGSASTTSGMVDLEGPVLPCTIRRIMGLAATKLSRTTEAASNPLTVPSPVRVEAAKEVGSYYVVLHTMEDDNGTAILPKAKPGEIMKRISGNSLAKASVLFNGISKNQEDSKFTMENEKIQECALGSALQLVVWDHSQQNVVACKLGSL